MRGLLIGAALALAGWAAVQALLPLAAAPGQLLAILGDSGAAVATVARADGRIMARRGGVILAQSDTPGFARRLYRAGAPLVLLARPAGGCVNPSVLQRRPAR